MTIDVTESNFIQTLTDQDNLVIVDFLAVWCSPCRLLTPTLEKLEDELDGRLTVLKINVDEQPGLARDYSIMSIPTMLVFKDGKKVKEIVGVKPKKQLFEEIEEFLD